MEQTHQLYSRQSRKWLYFVKVLKRAGVPRDHLLHYYVAVVRPVLENRFCIMASQHSSVVFFDFQTESIQRWALGIILNCGRDTSYTKMLADTDILFSRDELRRQTFFQSILRPDSCTSLSLVTTTAR